MIDVFSITKPLANCSAGLFVVIVLLAGCADTAGVRTLEPGESIVFGKVNVAQDDEQITDLNEPKGGVYRLILSRPNMATADEIILPDDGRFTWALEPGDYLLAAFYWMDASLWSNESSTRKLPVRAAFTVPVTPTSMYIGDINLQMGKSGYLVEIKDDFEAARVWLSQREQRGPTGPVRGIAEIGEIGTFDELVHPCADRWAVTCEGYEVGAKALQPKHQKAEVSMVESLTPNLNWSPAGSSNVTYDLVVYEAVVFHGISTELLPGRVVVYKQGLETPHYEVDQPLRPDTNYLWSVRFRDGDTVSEWSSTGHSNFAFYVVAFSWGKVRGELFAFRTPPIDGDQWDWLNR